MLWSASDIPDLTGRVAVVTGANSGLGLEVAQALARRGASVVLACRDENRGSDALRQVAAGAAAEPRLRSLDLADLASVRTFADGFAGSHDRLDILVNNAGVMAIPERRTSDGFEMQLGTNHLGHFALTGLLLPALQSTPSSRVVTVTSFVHYAGRIQLGDLHFQHRYGRWRAYNQSKLANMLFALELQRRLDRAGSHVLSVAAHPGYAATNLQTAASRMEGASLRERVFRLGNMLLAQSAAGGARPLLYAATAPDVRGGALYGPVLVMRGAPIRILPAPQALNPETARRLWEVSERLTGVRYDVLPS